MKNKGVMVSLATIVLIGMMITAGTHNFIEKHSGQSGMAVQAEEDMALENGAGERGGVLAGGTAALAGNMDREEAADEGGGMADSEGEVPSDFRGGRDQAEAGDVPGGEENYDFAADSRSEKDEQKRTVSAAFSENQAVTGQEFVPDGTGETPTEPKLANQAAAGVAAEETQSYYMKRLQDLDSQIQKNRDSQTGASKNSLVKTAASSELKLWDSELNDIYNALLERLGQEESEELVREERTWLKERDGLAMDAAKRSAGGSSESIEYTISLMESTRQRAYELAQRYAQLLEEQERNLGE